MDSNSTKYQNWFIKKKKKIPLNDYMLNNNSFDNLWVIMK